MKQVQKLNNFLSSSDRVARNSSRLVNHRGQALVEYVLLLIVAITMMLALKPLFRNAEGFTRAYIGDYLECLMDYGELPALGVDNSDLKKHTTGGYSCNAKFQDFSISTGRPPLTTSTLTGTGGTSKTGGSSGSGSRYNNSSDRNSRMAGSTSKNSSSYDNDSSSSGRSGRSGSNSDSSGSDLAGGGGSDGSSARRRSSPYSRGDIQRNDGSGYGTADGPAAAGANSKVRSIGSGSGGDDGGIFGGTDERSSRRGGNSGKYRAITGQQAEEIEKNTGRAAKQPTSRKITSDADGGGSETRRISLKRTDTTKEIKVEEKETSLGFGGMLKWVLIAGMIIAIIVFFGGQVLNYSKSE